MTDEVEKKEVLTNEPGMVDDNTEDYLTAIKELKANSVSRSEYEKLRAENKKLINDVVNGQQIEQPEIQKREFRSPEELNKILSNTNTSNMEYWEAFLELRDRCIELEGYDPCVTHGIGPNGPVFPEYGEEQATAEHAEILKEILRKSNGSKENFNAEASKKAKWY